MKSFLLGSLFMLVLIVVGGLAVLKMGIYPVNADAQPSWLEKTLTRMALHAHLDAQIKELKNPLTATPEVVMSGMKSFKSNCAGCHGSPTHKDDTFAKALFPRAPFFGLKGNDDDPRENFWIIKHGIRMTGMPAFTTMLSDTEIWQITAFIANAKTLPPNVQAVWQLPN